MKRAIKIIVLLIAVYVLFIFSLPFIYPLGIQLFYSPKWGPLETLLSVNQIKIIDLKHSKDWLGPEYEASFLLEFKDPHAFMDFKAKLKKAIPMYEEPTTHTISKSSVDMTEAIPEHLKKAFYDVPYYDAAETFHWEKCSVQAQYALSKDKRYLYLSYSTTPSL